MNDTFSISSCHHPDDVASKHSFIAERHQDFLVLSRLQSLFIQNSHSLGQVSSLQIDSTCVIASIINPNFRYYLNITDSRDCAIESLNFGGFEPLDGFLIFNSCSFLSKNNSQLCVFDVGANARFCIVCLKASKASTWLIRTPQLQFGSQKWPWNF